MGSREGITESLLTLLQHDKSPHSSLRASVSLCRVVPYRVKLAEAVGFIPLLIRSLIGASERGVMKHPWQSRLHDLQGVYMQVWPSVNKVDSYNE